MSLAVLAPEARLLFLAGTPGSDDAMRAVLAGPLDWALVCQLAEREGATVALRRRLRRLGPPHGGPEADGVERLARVGQFRMLYLEQRLADSVGALAQAGVECLLLKGAALASTVYPTFADRQMIDLDLLVRADAVPAALEALLTRGGWRWRPDRAPDDSYAALHHLPALLDARGMHVSLELHKGSLRPANPFGLTNEELFDTSRPAPVAGARVPGPLHLLLHTCVHFAWSHLLRKHAWRAFADVRALTAAAPVDWDEFVALARRTRAATCCYWTFRLAGELMGVRVPGAVLAALCPPLPDAALRALTRHFALTLLPTTVDCPSPRLRQMLWSAGMLPGWSGHGALRSWHLLPDHEVPSYAVPTSPARRPRPARGRDFAPKVLRYVRTLAFGAGLAE